MNYFEEHGPFWDTTTPGSRLNQLFGRLFLFFSSYFSLSLSPSLSRILLLCSGNGLTGTTNAMRKLAEGAHRQYSWGAEADPLRRRLRVGKRMQELIAGTQPPDSPAVHGSLQSMEQNADELQALIRVKAALVQEEDDALRTAMACNDRATIVAVKQMTACWASRANSPLPSPAKDVGNGQPALLCPEDDGASSASSTQTLLLLQLVFTFGCMLVLIFCSTPASLAVTPFLAVAGWWLLSSPARPDPLPGLPVQDNGCTVAPRVPAMVYCNDLADEASSVTAVVGSQSPFGQKRAPIAALETPASPSEALLAMPEQQPLSAPATPVPAAAAVQSVALNELQDPPQAVNLSRVQLVCCQDLLHPGAVFAPNGELPILFETDFFVGQFLPLIRTPENPPLYFADKKRMFEFQLQGQFTRCPPGKIWFGGEIVRPMHLSRMRQAVSNVFLRFVKAFGRGVHASFGDTEEGGERPHLVFPLLSAMDRIVVTPPGETPPPLGDEVLVTPDLPRIKKLASMGEDILVGHTYTMAFYSMYVDFDNWQTVHLPVRNMDLTGFWAEMGLHIVMYTTSDPKAQTHRIDDRSMGADFELVHATLPHFKAEYSK